MKTINTCCYIIFFTLIFISNKINLYTQDNPCSVRNPNEWIFLHNNSVRLDGIGLIGIVDIYIKSAPVFGLDQEFYIDFSTIRNKNEALSESTMKEIIEVFIATTWVSTYNCIIPATRTFSFYYQTACSYEKYSILKIAHDNTGVCCDDYPNDIPDLFLWNNEWYEFYKTIEPCGTKCCKKVYKLHCIYENGNLVKVLDPITTTYTIQNCSGGTIDICNQPGLPPTPPSTCSGDCD